MIKSLWVINMFDFFKKKNSEKTAAIVVAAGNSTRMGNNINKILIDRPGLSVQFDFPVFLWLLLSFYPVFSIFST